MPWSAAALRRGDHRDRAGLRRRPRPAVDRGRAPRDELAIAIAGPLVSLGMALPSFPLAIFVGGTGDRPVIAGGVLVIGGLNLVLGP